MDGGFVKPVMEGTLVGVDIFVGAIMLRYDLVLGFDLR